MFDVGATFPPSNLGLKRTHKIIKVATKLVANYTPAIPYKDRFIATENVYISALEGSENSGRVAKRFGKLQLLP